MSAAGVDKVTLQIFANHCKAAAESMAYTLMRTAHSTFVKETEDFTAGVAAPDGTMFASSQHHGATWFACHDFGPGIRLVSDYQEGDICITNDPYSGFVCSHTPDMHIWKPVFHRGELVCFAVGMIHNTDVGGAVPASASRALTEIHQEGIRIPPTKIMKGGAFDEGILKLMLNNVRVPEQNFGDLKAQIAAMNKGERNAHELIERFGIDTFRQGMHDLQDYAEQQARAVIRSIPNGEHFFCDYADEDSPGGYPCRVALTMKIDDDSLTMDFSGSDPQLTSAINMPTGGHERHVLAMVGLVYTLYSLDRTILLNSGTLRVAKALLPVGSVVNPQFPAATGMRSMIAIRVQTAILGAFSLAMPERMPAGQSSSATAMNVKTSDARGRSVMASINPITGGGGGTPDEDGVEGCGGMTGFFRNTPAEITESEVPIKIVRYGLARDSAGAGRTRGGLATVLEFQVFAPQTTVTARNIDRSRFQSWGTLGGRAGKLATFQLNPGTDREVELGNNDVVKAQPGDVIRMTSCGAGGYGSPFDRNASLVLHDVLCRAVSIEAARDEYGVVISGGRVDEAATQELRERLRARQPSGPFDLGEAREAFEQVWTRERYDALIKRLERLPIEWRFFTKHRIFAAMAQERPSAAAGSAVIDDLYAKVAREYPALNQGF